MVVPITTGHGLLKAALRRFGARVEASRAQSMVAVIFGAGGGTGSGMVVDLARHLSNVVFGRQALTVGIGILPCDGDKPQHRGGSLFATLNELDCLGDETKNQGVVTACGELFRNPFTAGVILVPQQPAWVATATSRKTQARISQEIARAADRKRRREPVGDPASPELGRGALDAAFGGPDTLGRPLDPYAGLRRHGREGREGEARPADRHRPAPSGATRPAPELQARVYRTAG